MATVLEFKRPAPPAPAKTARTSSKKTWRHPTKEYVRAEAEHEIALDGTPNVYTSYLKLYGRYPSPQQATAMGLKLGRRLRADDGKHHPPKSKAEKQHDKEVRARRKEAYRIIQGSFNAQGALQWLAAVGATPDEVVAYFRDGDGPAGAAIERDVDAALVWLRDFAAAWRARHPVKQDV